MPENIFISFSGINIIKIKDFIVQSRKYNRDKAERL